MKIKLKRSTDPEMIEVWDKDMKYLWCVFHNDLVADEDYFEDLVENDTIIEIKMKPVFTEK